MFVCILYFMLYNLTICFLKIAMWLFNVQKQCFKASAVSNLMVMGKKLFATFSCTTAMFDNYVIIIC